eukprot:Em0005g1239a
MYELFGQGRNYQELEKSIGLYPQELMEPYTRTDYTFRLLATAFAKKCSVPRQKEIFNWLSFLPFNGSVDLKNPNHEFHVLKDYGNDANLAPDQPLRVFFGRLIAHGQRRLVTQYAVRHRHFIANTSMDAQLSLIMANQALVTSGSLVYDPFVGSGSLLVAAAHFGGYVLGGDIDRVLIHGRGRTSKAGTGQKYRGKDENIRTNLRLYGLGDHYLDVLVADAASPVWRTPEMFDAIITDPPYGIREGARKVVSSAKQVEEPTDTLELCDEEGGAGTSMQHYQLSEVLSDLVSFAAKFLVVGGRLVYWLPFFRANSPDACVSSHPCLRVVSISEQPLQRLVARNLITMEKHMPWSPNHVCSKENSSDFADQDKFRHQYFNERKWPEAFCSSVLQSLSPTCSQWK